MDYRAIDLSQINDMNRSEQDSAAMVDDAMRNIDLYLARGRAERARVTLSGLRRVRQSIGRIFG